MANLGRPINLSISGTHENFDCRVTWSKLQASYVPNLMHKLLQLIIFLLVNMVDHCTSKKGIKFDKLI